MKRSRPKLLAALLAVVAAGAVAPNVQAQVSSIGQTEAALPDLSGLWVISNRSRRGNLDENLERMEPQQYLTEAGLAAIAELRPAYDPSAQCLPSIPRQISGPYPIEIVQRPGRIAMLFEWDTVFRLIYTDGREHPDPLEDQRFMGHAIGTWNGSVLEVDTANFNGEAWLEGSGIPMSTDAHVRERYWLEDNGATLRVQLEISDPAYLSRTVHRDYYFNRRSDWYIREYICAEGNRDNVFQPVAGQPGALQEGDVIERAD